MSNRTHNRKQKVISSSVNTSPFPTKKGLVLWGTKNIYRVIACLDHTYEINPNVTEVECRLKGKRGKVDNEYTFLLAGDYVMFQDTEDGYGMITQRLERKNSIMRRKQNIMQPIAVNMDVLLIISSLKMPSFRPRFIDRMIYIARCEQVDILLILNKLDLYIEESQSHSVSYEQALLKLSDDISTRIGIYTQIGVEVVFTSITNYWGIDKIIKTIDKKNVAVVGQSGVGKSSLINCLIPDSNRRTGAISAKYNRGIHITTMPEYVCGEHYNIIDTPGIRELYPTHTDMTSLIEGYPDIFKFALKCKLPNCTHRNEPNCGILPHIGTKINEDRYKSYVLLRESMERLEQNKWTKKC